MKAQSIKNAEKGFSTIEIMIALVVLTLALTGALTANVAAQYWSITSETSNEALYKAKTTLEITRAIARGDFYRATSTPMTKDLDATCQAGGLCYFLKTDVTDISSCSKYIEAEAEWRVPGYPTSTTSLFTYVTNAPETVARGGDCLVETPGGDLAGTLDVGQLNFNPGKILTGVDVLHGKIYATASTLPYLLVFNSPSTEGGNPTALGSSSGAGKELHALDVIDDLGTGRTYAYTAQNATTSQLAVFDVTDSANPTLVIEKKIAGGNPPTGSSAYGWRVAAYGSRLYIVTPQNSGNEFFIFDISTPNLPTQIGDGISLGATAHDLVVRDQKVGGSMRRLAYLATDSDTKEFLVLDVTGDSISEIGSRNLLGSADGLSIALLGNTAFLGRAESSSPDIAALDIKSPSAPTIINQGEVNADVIALQATGQYLFAGTRRSGQEFQVWDTDASVWNPSTLNVGRLASKSIANLAPRGIDLEKWVYVISQSASSDALRILYAE